MDALTEPILDHLPDPTVLLDADRTVVAANRAARELLSIGNTGQDLSRSLRHPRVLGAVDDVIGRAESRTIEFQLPGATAQNFEMHVAGIPQSPETEGLGAVLVLRDQTTARRAEQMRADFVANASHELRSPLAAILGFIETLGGKAGQEPETRDRFLAIMLREAERMSGLIDDLLALSRVEINEHVRPTAPVDIAGVLVNVVEALSIQAEDKSMPIHVDYGNGLPEVHGESDQLFQVFRNLIENAIRYGRQGTAINVVVQPIDRIPGAGLPGIEISVTDRGDGIPKEAIPRLTERFYRVDKARSQTLGGTGLGLAIVKHIVNRHRGYLKVDSELGKGSTFTVYLSAPADMGEPVTRIENVSA